MANLLTCRRAIPARPENLSAYDLVLQGLEHHRRSDLTGEDAPRALSLFEKTIEADPSYARAHAWRACSLSNCVAWDPDSYPENWFDECRGSAARALELNPDDHEANRIMGAVSLHLREFELAKHHHDRAEELCPSDSYILGKNAEMQVFLGNPDKGLEKVTWAIYWKRMVNADFGLKTTTALCKALRKCAAGVVTAFFIRLQYLATRIRVIKPRRPLRVRFDYRKYPSSNFPTASRSRTRIAIANSNKCSNPLGREYVVLRTGCVAMSD
mgnify:CR=1 FL=1